MSDLFISYSRQDKEFVHRLHDALNEQGRDVWVDWEDIPPRADWHAEIFSAIEAANSFLFVLSPDSVASQVCGEELAHAIQTNKRLVPIVWRDVDPKVVNSEITKLNWVYLRATDDSAGALKLLATAIDTDLDWVKAHTRLLTRSIEWNNKKRDDSLVLRGRDLRDAEEWQAKAASKEPKLTQVQSEYILASRKSSTKRQRIIVTGVTFGFIVAILLACVALFQADAANHARETAVTESNARATEVVVRATAEAQAITQRNIAQSRELAAVAVSQLNVVPERALLIAIQANQFAYTYEAEDVLRHALQTSHLGATLWGHGDYVTSAQFSPDGMSIVSASRDMTARVWDTNTNRERLILRGHEGVVTDAQFSPDGTRIATASQDNTARIWDAATGNQILVIRGASFQAIQFSPDGKYILTVEDGSVKLRDSRTAQELRNLQVKNQNIYKASFSNDSRRIVTLDGSNDAKLWDVNTGKELATLPLGDYINDTVQFSPDDQFLLTVTDNVQARIWNVASGKSVTVLTGHEQRINSARFSRDGKYIVTASDDDTARVWNAVTGKQLNILRGHEGDVVSAAFSPDGSRIVTASDDGTVRVWLNEINDEPAVIRAPSNNNFAAITQDSKRIVTSGCAEVASPCFDNGVELWETSTGRRLAVLPGYQGKIDAAFSPNGTRLITSGCGEWNSNNQCSIWSVRLWDAMTGRELGVLRGYTGYVDTVNFSPDGTRVVTTSEADGTARVWDAITGKALAVLRGHEKINGAQFSLDQTRIVTAGGDYFNPGIDDTARIWDAETGKELVVLRGHQGAIWHAEISPDGNRVLTASYDHTARIWDIVTGKELIVFPEVAMAYFSPDGTRVVTADNSHLGQIWGASTGKELAILRGHSSYIYSAHFSPDGTRIITASNDHTAQIWDAITGRELAILTGHEAYIGSAQYSPDSKRIVTMSGDGTLRIYLVRIEDLVALAKTSVTRELTCEERVQYLHEESVCPTPTPTVTLTTQPTAVPSPTNLPTPQLKPTPSSILQRTATPPKK